MDEEIIKHDGETIRQALITYFKGPSIAFNELCYIVPRLHTEEVISWLENLKKV